MITESSCILGQGKEKEENESSQRLPTICLLKESGGGRGGGGGRKVGCALESSRAEEGSSSFLGSSREEGAELQADRQVF